MVYPAGNFIECTTDTPYLQIGEHKYGKPVLDRAITYDIDLYDALKVGLVSVDSTMLQDIAVLTGGQAISEDLGIKLENVTLAMVTGVDPTGLGADQGLELGDVILEVSGKSVATPAEIRSALSDARRAGKQQALLRLRSGDATRFVAVPID